MNRVKIFFTLLFALSLSGCFSTKTAYVPKALQPHQLYTHDTYENQNISKALLDYYKQWQGVQYKYAGTSKKGVDCSYFVQDALKTSFNIKIPRTTKYQAQSGIEVSNKKTGDLVFFKTGYKKRHVGIYLNKGHFMHVSTSKGVIISRLDNPYWRSHYWKTQRILSK